MSVHLFAFITVAPDGTAGSTSLQLRLFGDDTLPAELARFALDHGARSVAAAIRDDQAGPALDRLGRDVWVRYQRVELETLGSTGRSPAAALVPSAWPAASIERRADELGRTIERIAPPWLRWVLVAWDADSGETAVASSESHEGLVERLHAIRDNPNNQQKDPS